MEPIPLREAQRQLPALVRAALAGEVVVISADDAGEVRLVPSRPEGQTRRFGSAAGLIEMREDFDEPLEDFREYTE